MEEDDARRKRQGKMPGIIVKGVMVAVAVAVLPLLQKQSSYANARSWELVNLLVVGLAVSYGLMARRPDKPKPPNPDTSNSLHKMFDFAGVFDDGGRDKVETWSSRCQPEEPLVVQRQVGEKPLLLPVRSLRSTLSNPDVFHSLNVAVQESQNEVTNAQLFTLESGNFEEQVDHANGETLVFPSPIPWASRRDVVNGAKDPHQPASEDLDGKSQQVPAIPSPIPWHSRASSPNVSQAKPSPSPPRPRQQTPPQKSSSPSPPRAPLENGSSPKHTPLKAGTTTHQPSAKETPPPPPPNNNNNNNHHHHNHANGDVSRHRDSKDVPHSASSAEVKPRTAPFPSPPPSTTPPCAVFEESPAPRNASENGVAHRSKGREGSSNPSDSRSRSRDASSDSQHSSRQAEIDVLKQKIKDTDNPPRVQPEKVPPPVYAHVPLADPLPPPPPPPPPPLYPDEPTSPPPSVSTYEEEHTACLTDGEKTTSPPRVAFEVGTSDSDPPSELLENNEDDFAGNPGEVDKKADQFIAKFHEQIRLQRLESIKRSQK